MLGRRNGAWPRPRHWVWVALAAACLMACGESAEGTADMADMSDMATDTSTTECNPDPVEAGPEQVFVQVGDPEANPFAWPMAAAHDVDGTLLATTVLFPALLRVLEETR